MDLVQKFNNLNGLVVNRTTLQYLLKRAEKERNSLIQRRIIKVLNEYKDDKFEIVIKDLIEPYALNRAELDFFDIDEYNEKEVASLNGIPQQEIYDIVTSKIIENLEDSTNWDDGQVSTKEQHIIAINFQTKKPYRGINQMLLGGNPLLGVSLENPYYLTFNQVEKLGGKVKTGAKSQDAIFYTLIYSYQGFKTNDKQKFIEHLKSTGISSDKEIKSLVYSCGYGILRIYNVFNGKDITGIDWKLPKPVTAEIVVTEKIAICETIIAKYPAPAPKYTTGGNGAYYQPSTDIVNMPKAEIYKDIRTFYAVYFHELVHSTGHSKRLNRGNDTRKRDGSKKDKNDYAFEELVAEIGASFLSANAGFFYFTKENAKSYINGWRQAIVTYLKEDNKGIFVASAKAQKAVDFMLQNVTEKDYEVTTKIEVKKQILPASKVQKKTKKEVKKSVVKTKIPVKSSVELKPKDKKKTRNKRSIIFDKKPQKIEVKKPISNSLNSVEDSEIKTKKEIDLNTNRNSLAYKMSNRKTDYEYFDISDKEISDFLGKIEKKEKESIVISLTGGQGSMKTRFAFQCMNALAQNNNCGHASIEEHPESKLYFDKADQYLNEQALQNIEAPEIKSVSDLDRLIKNNDFVVIDSYAKMQEIDKGFEVDKDLRKKYDGKLFLVIFQQTSDGKMRGGSKSQFDADIVLFTEKKENYKNNYVYADKNRYQNKSLDELKFNIFNGKLLPNSTDLVNKETESSTEIATSVFSFTVN